MASPGGKGVWIGPGACIVLASLAFAWADAGGRVWAAPPAGAEWTLVFADEFDKTPADLDANWQFQNGPSGHILCSRWRENVVLENGLLRLVARKEQRGGQDWTAASLWTRRRFKYGYFECRYRYLPATGTNNSFWIMTRERRRKDGSVPHRFEIDINEGHYPDEVNMNLHNWSGRHWAKGGRWTANKRSAASVEREAGRSFTLAAPVRTSRIRLRSSDHMVRIMELRVFGPSRGGYPSVFPNRLEAQPRVTNLALRAKATSSSTLEPKYQACKAIDGVLTNESRWVSGKGAGPHVLTLDFGQACDIGCIQFVSGWLADKQWRGVISDFAIECWQQGRWRPVPGASSTAGLAQILEEYESLPVNLGRTFHVYGLEWTETELVYYFDGKEIRRQAHTICRREAPVWLSLAIIRWAGPVTDAIDGKSMDVDYVRVYQRK